MEPKLKMRQTCLIKCCRVKSHEDPSRRYHRVPIDGVRRKMWLHAMDITESELKPNIKYFVCDLHFVPNDYSVSNLKYTVVPTRFLTSDDKPDLSKIYIKKEIDDYSDICDESYSPFYESDTKLKIKIVKKEKKTDCEKLTKSVKRERLIYNTDSDYINEADLHDDVDDQINKLNSSLELPALNCVDLFPNPPKYIDPELEQEKSNAEFNGDSNESVVKSIENEQELINQFIDEDEDDDSLEKFEKELEIEKDHPEVTEEDIERIGEPESILPDNISPETIIPDCLPEKNIAANSDKIEEVLVSDNADSKHSEDSLEEIICEITTSIQKPVNESEKLIEEILSQEEKQEETFLKEDKQEETFLKEEKQEETFLKEEKQEETFLKEDKQEEHFLKEDKQEETILLEEKQEETILLEEKCETQNENKIVQKTNVTLPSTTQTDSPTLLPASLPATSPALSISSYYSSAESVSSISSIKKKKKKRYCQTCDIRFHRTRELLAHLKVHVSKPAITLTKLCETDSRIQDYYRRQKEVQEQNKESGALKLKLKLSGTQNFQVVPFNFNRPSLDKSKKGSRILTAREIQEGRTHPPEVVPPIDAMVAMSELPLKPDENSIESRYFECPTLDGLDQFAEEASTEATDDLLKKLLEGGQQQMPQETDWTANTNEFISIDRLAHMCTVCHCNFPDAMHLYEHKRITGHDFQNSMQPPPPPHMNIPNNFRPRMSFTPTHMNPGPYQPPGPQMGPMVRSAFPGYPPQRFGPAINNFTQQQMMQRRPPPLYRVPSPQNPSPVGTPPFNEMTSEMFVPPHPNGMIPNQNYGPPQQMNQLSRQPVFLKTRLQRPPLRPKLSTFQNSSPNGTPSPPIFMAPPQTIRPRFLSPPGGPPAKKIKREPEDNNEAITPPQVRMDGLPVIQSVQGGVSPMDLDKSKDTTLYNDQTPLSGNKNPKEVANILANRGITVTHKTKPSLSREGSPKGTQDAVQKLQLNNSVSIISKKRPESGGEESPKLKTGDAAFISCPFADCEEKFLTVEGLNRHTQRGHRINKTINNLKAFRCRVCPAMFSTQDGLMDHQRKNHRMLKTSADELGIPVIDLRNEQTKQKLATLGIINYIPLTSKQANGCFGFPIVSVQGTANPNVCNMAGLGVNSLLSLGPIKPIPLRKSD